MVLLRLRLIVAFALRCCIAVDGRASKKRRF